MTTVNAMSSNDNIYINLGVRPIVNGVGTVTHLGGSIMPPEVVDAMVEASKHFVDLRELNTKAGKRIAELIGVPGAAITSGAASATTVATAACITRGDANLLRKLPDTSDMKNQVIRQRSHGDAYEAQVLLVGAKTVWVETTEQFAAAFNDRTAMTLYMNWADPQSQIGRDVWLDFCKQHGVPAFLDAAADIPPVTHLREYVDEGFDLVAFSGGKGLSGPQASGLLLGRADLIAAAQALLNPQGGIGRGMKVGKEEIMGLLAAVERYLKMDHAAERRELDERAERMKAILAKDGGLDVEIIVREILNAVPHVIIKWDESQRRISGNDVAAKLRAGDPPIAVSRLGPGGLRISTWMLKSGEDRLIADRLLQIFSNSD